MRADRDKRAVILTAEGQRQAAILTAEGIKQSAILNAEGDRESLILRAQADRESQILRAQGEGQAIQTVFQAIHDGQPDQSLLAYQYLQMMPKIAEGDANKVWVIPTEITKALEGLGSSIHELAGHPRQRSTGRASGSTWAPPSRSLAVERASTTRAGQRPTPPSRRRSPRPSAPPRPGRGARAVRRPTAPGRPTRRRRGTGGAARASDAVRGRRDPARRARGRHDQHRRGVGDADHVPDPAGVRRPAGHRQRLQHRRPGARARCRARSATARELVGPALAGCSGSASRR